MKIAIGCDHRGIDFKNYVIGLLNGMDFSPQDFGSYTPDPVDYPDIAAKVCSAVLKGESDFGILICGTGIGMSIAANKIKGIRAALCIDAFASGRARSHNNANIICLSAERGEQGIPELLKAFFDAVFEGGRHQKRNDKISGLESGTNLI